MRLSGIGLPRGSQGGQAGGRLLRFLHLDGYMLATVAAISVFGLLVLYSASGGELGFWLRQVARLGAHEHFVTCLALHPTAGAVMATGSADHTVKLWPCA